MSLFSLKLLLKNLSLLFIFNDVNVCPVEGGACALVTLNVQKKISDPPELDLQLVVGHLLWILWKQGMMLIPEQYFQPLSCFCRVFSCSNRKVTMTTLHPPFPLKHVTGGAFFSWSNSLLPTHSQFLLDCFKLHRVLRRVLVIIQNKTVTKEYCLQWPLSSSQHLLMFLDLI